MSITAWRKADGANYLLPPGSTGLSMSLNHAAASGHDVVNWINRSGSALASVLVAVTIAGCASPTDFGQRVFGYVDTRGRVVIPPVYENARPFHEGRAAVNNWRGWGFIDAAGHWIVPPIYLRAESFSDGRARVRAASGVWGYVDRSGAVVIPPQFSCESPFFGGHAFVEPPEGPVRVIDEYGHTVRTLPDVKLEHCDLDGEAWTGEFRDAPPAWKSLAAAWDESWLESLHKAHLYAAQWIARVPSTRRAATSKTGSRSAPVRLPEVSVQSAAEKIGYLDPQGNWAVPPMLAQEAGPFVDGLARVTSDRKVGFIDRSGRVVVPFQFDEALFRFSRDRTVAVRDRHAWLIDRTGRAVVDLGVWPWPDLGEGEDFDQLARYVGLSDFFSDGLIPWPRQGKWGYVSVDGKWLVDYPNYTAAQPFQSGFATVQIGERWVLIDARGHPVMERPGEWIGPRAGSLTRAGTSTRWGFVGADGRPPRTLPFATTRITYGATSFVDTRPLTFNEGLAVVSEFARPEFRLIDEHGRTVAKGRFEGLAYVGRDRFAYLSDEHWGLLDTHFRIIVPARFDVRTPDSRAREENQRDRVLMPMQASAFGQGYVFARLGELGACIDPNGHWAFPPQPLLRARCSAAVMPAQTATGWGALGLDGRWRIPPRYASVALLSARSAAYFIVTKDELSRLARVSRHAVHYSAPGDLTCGASSRSCLLKVGNRWQRLDPRTLQPTGPIYDEAAVDYRQRYQYGPSYSAGLFVRIGRHWGYLAKSGALTVPIRYDEIRAVAGTSADADHVAAVRQGQRWGVVSLLDGRMLIPLRFDQVKAVGRGYYAVRLRGRWGVVRGGAQRTVSFRFDDILSASDGLFLAKIGGRLTLVTVDGQMVRDPAPEWMQHIRRLTDYTASAWSAYTDDHHYYFIEKRTLSTHQLRLPRGYDFETPLNPVSFRHFDDRVLPIYLQDAPEPIRAKAVLLNEVGELLVPEVFDGAAWSQHAKRFVVEQGERCGVLDTRGHWVVPMRYASCHEIGSPPWVIAAENSR